VDLLDERGQTLEQVAFADIALGQRPADADLAPSTTLGLMPVRPLPAGNARAPAWEVQHLPPGFRLRAAKPLPGGGAHLLYSDGLASVSVYVEPADASLRGGSQRQRGAVHARSFWVDGWQVMAIGKVPADTVDHFARNLRAIDADG
jgi:sigma-E factor negative regulatory protein RseB